VCPRKAGERRKATASEDGERRAQPFLRGGVAIGKGRFALLFNDVSRRVNR
jgi:hypothetical protein